MDDFAMFLEVYEKLNLKDCLCMVADAWEGIDMREIQTVWKNVFRYNDLHGLVSKYPQRFDEFNEKDLAFYVEIVKSIPGLRETTEVEVNRWLEFDSDDQGFRETDTSEDEVLMSDHVPSHAEAYEALTIALKWFEKQKEVGKLSVNRLKRIQDLAEAKALRSPNHMIMDPLE